MVSVSDQNAAGAADSACGLEARQNAVSELHTLDQFWQLVVAVDPAMTGSGSGKR